MKRTMNPVIFEFFTDGQRMNLGNVYRKILAVGTVMLFFGIAVCVAQAQMMAGAAVATTPQGNPIYANQGGYFGLNCGCADGNCGNHAVGPLVAGGCATACTAPCSDVCGMPCGDVCSTPCGDVCGAPCGDACCAPCGEVCGPCLPCLPLPCLPCLPCMGCCGACEGGIIGRIWNGPNYWQGPGCSERVIDELRKSWVSCPKCDLMGETCSRSPNSIGTGLRSSQLVNAGAPYGPIKMNAGQPEKGVYSAPSPYCTNRVPGSCTSCQKGITVTANQPNTMIYEQPQGQNYTQTYVQPQNYTQVYTQPQVQNYAQSQPQTYTQTYVQPQNVQQPIQQVQYQEPVRQYKNQPKLNQPKQNQPKSNPRFSGSIHYRANYTPSTEVPGYLKAQQNAEKTGIGFDSLPKKPGKSAWKAVSPKAAKSENQNSVGKVVPVNYDQSGNTPETVATPAPRTTGTEFTSTNGTVNTTPSPSMGSSMAFPVGDGGIPCGTPCETPCEAGCVPCEFPCKSCGSCFGTCGECWGGCCGEWPGLIPLAADAVRFTGRVVCHTGRAAVLGTKYALCGTLRATKTVLWNRPCPLEGAGTEGGCCLSGGCLGGGCLSGGCLGGGCLGGGCLGGGCCLSGGCLGDGGNSGCIDPVYAENDMYLNASNTAPSAVGLQASALPAKPNLYESGYYPQNYTIVSDTAINPVPDYSTVPAVTPTVPATPTSNTMVSSGNSNTANLLSFQSQHVFLEDGTEVILEHDSMVPENRSFNSSVQYASANESSAPAFQSVVPASTSMVQRTDVNSGSMTNVAMKSAAASMDSSTVSSVPMMQASYGSESVQEIPLEDAPSHKVPVVSDSISSDGFPIVSAEQPQIQLAPGEVLVSQEDFVLLPAEPQKETPNAAVPENVTLQPISETVPAQELETPTNRKDSKPVCDSKVTRVSYIQPVACVESNETEQTAEYRNTDSGWMVRQSEDSQSLLGLKRAVPLR